MAKKTLADRVSALEVEVARLKLKIETAEKAVLPWSKQIAGTFANDPIYDEAMRLGRKYRESTRPKPAKRRERAVRS